MRGSRPGWLVAALAVSLLSMAVGAHAVEGLGGALEGGQMHYVEVVDSDSSGVIAGLVTQTEEGPLGLASQTTRPVDGWVLVHPEDVEPAGEAEIVEEIAFEDPNGGTWFEREVRIGEDVAWAVPIDVARHDPTLDAEYNFALVVDWDKVPQDVDLETSYVEELTLLES